LFREGEEEAEFESGSDQRKRDAIRKPSSKWQSGIVPYVISNSFSKEDFL